MEDTLGGRLAHARDSAGLSLEKVARAVGLHAATINYWEADRAEPSMQSVEALARVLNVSTLWLLTGFGDGPDDSGPEPMPLPLMSRAANRKVQRRPRQPRG
jgi:transcriptional regulator with XRE-family HTH domain